MPTMIHPSAVVEPGAQLGTDVTIGPFAFIENRTRIGDNTEIGAYAQIKACTSIGACNRISSYAYIGGDPQDLKYSGTDTFLEIGDKNVIREFSTIHRGTENGSGTTRIGSQCMLMAYAHVAHDSFLGDGVILGNGTMLSGHVHIDNHAVISGMSGVHQFSRIGEYSFIGGMSGILMDVPPYTLAAGTRAQLRGLNVIGLKRSGMPDKRIRTLKKCYRILWREQQEQTQAQKIVEEEYGDIFEVKKLLEFIRSSKRGVLTDGGKGRPRNRSGQFED